MNPFLNVDSEFALKYLRARPKYHEKAFSFMHDFSHFESILDLCCGVGDSTLALSRFGKQVIGYDASSQMIEHAHPHEKISYVVEDIYSLRDGLFDLVVISNASHWLDLKRILIVLEKNIKANGYLLIESGGFTLSLDQKYSFSNHLFSHVEKLLPARYDASKRFLSKDLKKIFCYTTVTTNEIEFSKKMNGAEFLALAETWSSWLQANEEARTKYKIELQKMFLNKRHDIYFSSRSVLYQRGA